MLTIPALGGPTLAATEVTTEQVEGTLGALMARLGTLDPGQRAMLPARRTIEARCTDLDVMYHAHWRDGQLGDLVPGPAGRADIRVHVTSTDLMALVGGTLTLREAWASRRVRVDASVTDLLRLRAVL